MNKRLRYLLFITLLLGACSTTKYLAPGQKLYVGPTVNIVNKDIKKADAKALKAEMEALVRPVPNSSILGLRYKLYIYFKTRTTKKKGLRHYLNTKLGEPPVLISAVDVDKNSTIMQNRLQNEGYFLADVSGDTAGVKKTKTAKAIFTAETGPAYKIRNISFPTDQDKLDTAVAGTAKQTFLKVGNNYNLDVLKNERLRIDARLKEEGFYYFSPDNLIMRVDSTVAGHQVDIYVKVKAKTPEQARRTYTINNIYLYPNYSLRDTSLKLDSEVFYRWYNVIDPQNTVRPFVFKNSVLLHPGDVYNRTEHNRTLSRFIDLGPFKFVKNRFQAVSEDSSKLDVYYFLTQFPKNSFQLDLVGRQTSANYDGTQVNISYRNRNLFKGAELFTLTLFASSDVQFGSYNKGYNVYQIGIQPSLSWPRFISPFNFHTDNAFIPRTILTAGYTIINRTQLYTLNSFNAAFGYQWKPSLHVQNNLNLIEATYVDPENITKVYLDSIQHTRNPALAHVIDKQFTFGPTYSYLYTNTTESYRTNTFYYKGKISLSANLYGLVTGADTLNGKVGKLFGTPFDQYVKLENEIRFFHKLSAESKLATRFMVDVGIPYGNSTVLPYTQQFFIGGANSLRGFQAHSIGPGAYVLPTNLAQGTNFLPDESGDIKIEANVEYRPKLFSIVEGALFVDAGNIWLLHSNVNEPGATFGKNFLSQIAADAGFGLRFNLSVLLLRTDIGFPFLEPNSFYGQHLVLNRANFNNAVFNLAIGYPF